jgi:outer membrane protein assembly factor BamB
MRVSWIAALVMTFVVAMGASAEEPSGGANWPQWRGPNFNGFTSATNLPQTIDKSAPLWVANMPGHGNGTPIVWGDRFFTTATQDQSMALLAICLNKADGKVLWQKEVGVGTNRNRQNNHAATPSPVTDGLRVIFLFGNGELASFDMQGNQQWRRNLQKDHGKWNIQWAYGASPLLWGGKLYVPVLHRNVSESNFGNPRANEALAHSYLLAIDPGSGQDLWKMGRPTDAKAESQEAYSTPIPWVKPSRNEILITGGDAFTGHDPETGKELWRVTGWNPQKRGDWRLVPSPVTWDGLAYVCTPKREGVIIAVREGGSGDVTNTHVAWRTSNPQSDVCVPAVWRDHLYVLDGDKRQLYCVNPKTGDRIWAGTFQGRGVMRGSPTVADGKVYCTSEAGDLFIASADTDPTIGFKQLSKAELGDRDNREAGPTRSSVAAVDGMILVRTGDKVWAFGKK